MGNYSNGLKIKRFKAREYFSNCFCVINNANRRALLIDPGDRVVKNLVRFMKWNRLTLDYVILTHEHFDHIAGVNPLRKKYEFKIIATVEASACFQDPRKNLSLFYYMDGIGIECPAADITIDGLKSPFIWNEHKIEFIKTPGHSLGSMCVSIGDLLFSGDTIIPGVKTITKLPGSSKETVYRSLKTIYSRFGDETIVFPGHGDPLRLCFTPIEEHI